MQTPEVRIQAIQEVLTEILEKFAYMFVDPAELGTVTPEGNDFLCARMKFDGHRSGKFTLLVPRAACAAITANILGFEEGNEFVQEHLEDGIKEFLNIAGAHVLTKVAGENAVFRIDIPEVEPFTPEDWSRLVASGEGAAVMGDSHPIVMRMTME